MLTKHLAPGTPLKLFIYTFTVNVYTRARVYVFTYVRMGRRWNRGKNRQLVSQAEKLPLNVFLLAFFSLGQSAVRIGGRRSRHQVLRLCPLLLCIYSFRIVFIVVLFFLPFFFIFILVSREDKNCFTPLWLKLFYINIMVLYIRGEIIFNIQFKKYPKLIKYFKLY